MKRKRMLLLFGALIISLCAGCSAENTTTEQIETAVATTTEENIPEQTETTIPEETTAPTPEVTEEPSEETTAELETVEATTDQTSEPKPTEEPEYTYTDMTATMYATQTVNVRDLPSTDGEKVGSLSTNQEVPITGQASTGWYRIQYEGGTAYVSDKYLADEKVEVQTPADNGAGNSGGGQAQAPSTPASNYEKNVWYDMGDYFCIFVNNEDEFWYYNNNADGSCDAHRAILQERYPDRKTYVCSAGQKSILVISALHPTAEGFPNWSEINYIPEIGF